MENLINFLKNKKNEAIDDFTCEDLAWDDDTVINVELSFGEIDQAVEILSAFADVSEDDDWEDEDDE